MHMLNKTSVYLGGAMSFDENATMWRNSLTPFLRELGITVFDPCNKPCEEGHEDQEYQRELIACEQYDALSNIMRSIRAIDRRLVTISDFLIVDVDITIYTVGTWDEFTLANDQDKPIIIRVEQGKQCTPPWIFGVIPHEMIFSTWEEVKTYLNGVDANLESSYSRWMFFDR